MKSKLAIALTLVMALAMVLANVSTAAAAQDKKDKKKGGNESAPAPDEAQKQIGKLMKEIQFDLEGGSSRSFLSRINTAKFDDYPRFEDNVERLMRENSLRVNFRTAFTAPPTTEGVAQSSVDSTMELVKKDSVAPPTRRNGQVTFDFEWTNRGWKITNITPRSYFQP
jgi:hypothetical protein